MLKIVICDDENVYIEQIRTLVSNVLITIPILYSLDSFSSGEELFQNLQNGTSYDVAFLDIHMDGINGIDIADKIRKHFQNNKTILIYISSYDTRAKEVFQFKTHRFLSKPIEKLLFEEALISSLQLWKEQQASNFAFRDTKLGLVQVPFHEILYIESSHNHRVNVITTDNIYTIYDIRLSDIHEKLSSSDFILIHHSTLVNFDHIKTIGYEKVTMSDDKVLSISGPKRKDIRKQFYEIRKVQEKNLWL